jgi:hypothetical protein
MQRTLGSASLPFGVAGASLFESIVRVQVRPGPDLAIHLVDPFQAGPNQFFGSNLAAAYFAIGLGGGKFDHCHAGTVLGV